MNNTLAESKELVRLLNVSLSCSCEEGEAVDGAVDEAVEVVVCPPFTALQTVSESLRESIKLGAQNVYPAQSGAYTGEVSPEMLKELGCEYVLIGHSERRQLFHESDDFIAAKLRAVLSTGLTPVLCLGETLPERQRGEGKQVVLRQLHEGLKTADYSKGFQIVVAYEPVWAIGTGQAASPEQVAEIIEELHQATTEILPQGCGVRFLYGGSVTPANITDFVSHKLISGALVGGVSLKADQFTEVVRRTGEIRKDA